MSFTEVLEELPTLTVQQRQLLIRRTLELDDPPMTRAEETLVENRLKVHRKQPGSFVPLHEMKRRLRS